jgi:hypothetical protein
MRRPGLRHIVADKSRLVGITVRAFRLNMVNYEDELMFCGRRLPLLYQDLIVKTSEADPDGRVPDPTIFSSTDRVN